MSTDPNTNPNPQADPAPIQMAPNTGYSADYVKQLRDEAASWRTKFREAETGLETYKQSVESEKATSTLKSELDKRQLKVDPNWIKVDNGQTPTQAVDKFLKDYPQWNTQTTPAPETNPGRQSPRPITPQRTNTNQPGNPTVNDYQTTKSDPVARAKVRENYKALLNQHNNTGLSL